MIERIAASKIRQLAGSFKSVAITGPRQSGKTTLAKSLFSDKTYLSLENPDVRRFALGHEVDIIIDNGLSLVPVEIKAGKTVNNEFFGNLSYWKKLSGERNGYIAYAGNQIEERSSGISVLNWFELLKRAI